MSYLHEPVCPPREAHYYSERCVIGNDRCGRLSWSARARVRTLLVRRAIYKRSLTHTLGSKLRCRRAPRVCGALHSASLPSASLLLCFFASLPLSSLLRWQPQSLALTKSLLVRHCMHTLRSPASFLRSHWRMEWQVLRVPPPPGHSVALYALARGPISISRVHHAVASRYADLLQMTRLSGLEGARERQQSRKRLL